MLVKLLFFALALLPISFAQNSSNWQFSLSSGYALNSVSDIFISQNGYEDIVLRNAKLVSKPFTVPYYYSFKASRKIVDEIYLEFELFHHKLYLEDLPKDVERYEISDGYNLVFVNLVTELEPNLNLRTGLGLVVAHPDIIVRGKTNLSRRPTWELFLPGSGYHISGWTSQIGLDAKIEIWGALSLIPEFKITYSQAVVPIAEGSTIADNVAMHFLLGLKYSF